MDVATIKKDLENQIGDINKELKNIYLPLEAVLILLGKRTAFQIALELIDSLQQEQKPAGRSKEDSNIAEELYEYFWHLQFESDKEFSPSLSFDEVLEWLKSLKNRGNSPKSNTNSPSWKPSEEQPEGLHFTPLNRLIQKIPSKNWNDTVNNYAKKLRDCLVKEGYRKDAEVLQGYISYMNGNNVPMATMDEQEQPQVADASKMEQPGAPVDGEVHHVLNCHYLSTDNTQLCERLREFPEGAKVDIFIFAKEDK